MLPNMDTGKHQQAAGSAAITTAAAVAAARSSRSAHPRPRSASCCCSIPDGGAGRTMQLSVQLSVRPARPAVQLPRQAAAARLPTLQAQAAARLPAHRRATVGGPVRRVERRRGAVLQGAEAEERETRVWWGWLAAAGSSGGGSGGAASAQRGPAGCCSVPIYCRYRGQLLETARRGAEGALAQADAALSCGQRPGGPWRADPARCTVSAVPRPARRAASAVGPRAALALAGSILARSLDVLGTQRAPTSALEGRRAALEGARSTSAPMQSFASGLPGTPGIKIKL